MFRRVLSLARASAALAVGAAGVAPAAHAETICVQRTGCTHQQAVTGSPGADLAAAIVYAASTSATDTILLGDGRYDQGSTFYFKKATAASVTGDLTIQGAGPAKVTIANSGTTTDDETLEGDQSAGALTVTGLTIEGPANAATSLGMEIGAANSKIANVRVVSPANPIPGALLAAIAVRKSIAISDVTIAGFRDGITQIVDPSRVGGGKWTIDRTAVSVSGTGIATTQNTGTLAIQNSVVDSGATAIAATCGWVATARFVTVRSPAPSGVIASCNAAQKTSTIALSDAILAPGTSVRGEGGDGDTSGGIVELVRTRYSLRPDDGFPLVSGTVNFTAPNYTAAPRFRSPTDLRLAADSPLIDRGAVTGSATADVYKLGDRDGSARIVDGDANGSALPDLGAYEAPKPGTPPTTPAVTTPTPTTPKPTSPAPTTPKPTSPAPTTPKPTSPAPTTPAPTTPKPTTPASTTPTPTSPAATTPPPVVTPPAVVVAPGVTPPVRFQEIAPYPGVTLKAAKVRLDAKGRVLVRAACPTAAVVTGCTGLIEVQRTTGKGKKRKFVTVGGATLKTLPPGRSVELRIKLTRATLKTITAAGRKFTVRASTYDGREGARPVGRTASLTVRPKAS